MLAVKRTEVTRDRNGWKLVWRGADAACFVAGEAWRVDVDFFWFWNEYSRVEQFCELFFVCVPDCFGRRLSHGWSWLEQAAGA